MADRQTMIDVIQEYCRAENTKDKAAWLVLFAPEATHEDPVGNPVNAGIDKIAAFWDTFQPYDVDLRVTGDIVVNGNEAIAPMQASVGPADARATLGPIYDYFVFNDAGKITQLRAFYES